MGRDEQIAAKVGMTVAELKALQDASQDDETRGFIELARRDALPRLLAAKWPLRYEGEDGIGCLDQNRTGQRLIHSICRELDGEVWAHVSLSRRDRTLPDWTQTRDAWWLLYDQVPGVIVVAPRTEHVNLGEVAHVWACLTKRTVPDFARGLGTI